MIKPQLPFFDKRLVENSGFGRIRGYYVRSPAHPSILKLSSLRHWRRGAQVLAHSSQPACREQAQMEVDRLP